jgi:hypothetical protein
VKTRETLRALGPCKYKPNADFTFARIFPSIVSEPWFNSPFPNRGYYALRTTLRAEEGYFNRDHAQTAIHAPESSVVATNNMKRHILAAILFSAIAVAAKDPAAASAKDGECCVRVRLYRPDSNATSTADLYGRRVFRLRNAQAWESSTSMGFALKIHSKRCSQTL